MSEVVTKELPENWEWSTLGDVCEHPQYGWTTKASQEGGLHLLRTTDITSGQINWDTVPYCVEEPEDKEKYLIKDGDIVVSRAGSVGVSYLISNPEPSVFASYLIRFKPLIDRKYVFYFLKSPAYWNAISEKSAGIALQNVNASKLKEIHIPVAPPEQQKRIVAKIEELFSHIDAGIEALKKAKQLLKQYRQSILKATVTGELTKEWREANKDKLESASALLNEIEAEKERLIKNKKLKRQKKLPELDGDEKSFEIPPEWEWCKFGLIAEFINGDRGKNYPNKSEYVDSGVPWINTGHINPDGSLSETDMNFITREKFDSLRSGKIREGDLVYCLRGATFGKTAFVSPYKEGSIASSLMIIRPYITDLNTFIYRYLTSTIGKDQLFRFDNGSAQPNLSANNVKLYAFPLPPLKEQEEINKVVDLKFSAVEHLDRELDAQLMKAEKNKQSILASAFNGGLS